MSHYTSEDLNEFAGKELCPEDSYDTDSLFLYVSYESGFVDDEDADNCEHPEDINNDDNDGETHKWADLKIWFMTGWSSFKWKHTI